MLNVLVNDKQYRIFIKYAFSICNSFSLTFEKSEIGYVHQDIFLRLSEHLLFKKSIYKHPDTGTLFQNSDIVYFKCNNETYSVLQYAYSLYDWNGENFPEELCFYINQKVKIICICHEKLLLFFDETEEDLTFLKNNKIIFQKEK